MHHAFTPPGSSPLARGTHLTAACLTHQRRLIPARAGNTPPPGAKTPGTAAHPRSRGEHDAVGAELGNGFGSSPLARGTQRLHRRRSGQNRLIPARAGNTRRRSPEKSPWSAHPRSRGEHPSPPHSAAHTPGSSPLARGTPLPRVPRGVVDRLIPARAGNTLRGVRGRSGMPAHPRSRGEHAELCRVSQTQFGSSPLARGTPSNRT